MFSHLSELLNIISTTAKIINVNHQRLNSRVGVRMMLLRDGTGIGLGKAIEGVTGPSISMIVTTVTSQPCLNYTLKTLKTLQLP